MSKMTGIGLVIFFSLALVGCGNTKLGSAMENSAPDSDGSGSIGSRAKVELVDVEALMKSETIFEKNWTIFEASSGSLVFGNVIAVHSRVSGREALRRCASLSTSNLTACVINGYLVLWSRMNGQWVDEFSDSPGAVERLQKFKQPNQLCAIFTPRSHKLIRQWRSKSRPECRAEAARAGMRPEDIPADVDADELRAMTNSGDAIWTRLVWGDETKFSESLYIYPPDAPLAPNCFAITPILEQRSTYPSLGQSFQVTRRGCEDFCMDLLEKNPSKTIQCQMYTDSVRLLVPVTNRIVDSRVN